MDAGKLERVLLNLLSNAFKFTPAGGRIRCALEAGRKAPWCSPCRTAARACRRRCGG